MSSDEPALPKPLPRPLPDRPPVPVKPRPDSDNPTPDRPMYGHNNFPSAAGSSFMW
jgi:hypothetical protein